MSKRLIDIGIFPNDGEGDTLREGGTYINDNFGEIYSALSIGQTTIDIGFGKTVISLSNDYNVGFGSTQPSSKLDVVGNAKFSGIVTASTFKGSSQIGISTGGNYIGLSSNINFVGSGISITSQYNSSLGISTILLSVIPGLSTAAGSSTNIQFNSSGSLAGSNQFVFDGSKVIVGSALTLSSSGILVSAGVVTARQLVSVVPLGTAPLSVASSTLVSNLNSSYLSGLSSSFYTNASNLINGTISSGLGTISGSSINSFLIYNGTTRSQATLYGGTTLPVSTTRLNYDGYFYATKFYGDGSGLTNVTPVGAGFTIYDSPSTSNGAVPSNLVGMASALNFAENLDVVMANGIATVSSPNLIISSTNGNNSSVTYPVLVGVSATGNQVTHIDNGLAFNAVTNSLTATSFNGNITGTSGTITFAVGTAITYTRGLFSNIGVNTTNPTSSLTVGNDVLVVGVVTAREFFGKFNGEIPDGSVTAPKMAGLQTGPAPTYAARAFLVMDGQSATPDASRIIYGKNIASVNRKGSGLYEVTFQTAMHTDKYCVLATLEKNTSAVDPDDHVVAVFDKKVNRFQIKTYEVKATNNNYQDSLIINLVIFA